MPKVEKQREGLKAQGSGLRAQGKDFRKMLDTGVLSAYITTDE